jgi:hypothetical protein
MAKSWYSVRFEFLKPMAMKIKFLSDVTPYNFVERRQCFWGAVLLLSSWYNTKLRNLNIEAAIFSEMFVLSAKSYRMRESSIIDYRILEITHKVSISTGLIQKANCWIEGSKSGEYENHHVIGRHVYQAHGTSLTFRNKFPSPSS